MKVIEHVYINASAYGVDQNQICASGQSGGGWICFGGCNLLTKAGKAYMVKAQFILSGMLSNET